MNEAENWGISRRDFLRAAGTLGVSGALLGAYAGQASGHDGEHHAGNLARAESEHMSSHGGNGVVGSVDTKRFNPTVFLRHFYWGEEHKEAGKTVREYELTAQAAEIEVAPGVMYPAWAYNGQVPGPTLRAQEGDRLRVVFRNQDAHPHTIHFHGFHPANMDGVFELVGPGQEFVYEFILEERPPLVHFLWLALLGGGPAIVGTWIGGFAFSNLLATVFLAVGAGAILQVIYEVTRLLLRAKGPVLSAPNLGGFVGGVAIMYATALLVSV